MFPPPTATPGDANPEASEPDPRVSSKFQAGPGTFQTAPSGATPAQPCRESGARAARMGACSGVGGKADGGVGSSSLGDGAGGPKGPRGAEDGNDGDDDDSASTASGQQQQEPDPLYDDTADDADAAWADRQRGGRVSDAVLSCPGCFTTLCIDCQRHEKYHNQYRAMFVMNCVLEDEEEQSGAGHGGGGREGAGFDPSAAGRGRDGRRPKRARGSALYRRVLCGVCDTEVGALEVEQELYHFYQVFPSNA